MLREKYERDGHIGPLSIFTKTEIQQALKDFKKTDKIYNLMQSDYRCKSQVLFKWVDQLTRHPKLVHIIQELLGPDFGCWDVLFWVKKPHTNQFVSYHQDGTYWNFKEKQKALTVWIPLESYTEDFGLIQYLKDQNDFKQKPHSDIKDSKNLLMRGQTVDGEYKSFKSYPIQAGEVMIHNGFIIHGSGPNKTDQERIACGIIFVANDCSPIKNISPESYVHISGLKKNLNMHEDPKPTGNWRIDYPNWKRAYDWQHDNYYAMTQEY